MQSDTAVEQLLGRVLRMPYARQRRQEVLNRAYAHLVSPEFAQAAERLKDRLVQMGFDRLEAAIGVQPGTIEPFWHDETDHPITPPQPAAMPFVLTVNTAPDLEALPDEVRERVEVQPLATGFRVTVRGEIIDAIEDALLDAVPKKRQEEVTTRIRQHQALQQALTAPAARGERFSPLPRLGVWVQGEFELLEKESFITLGEWSLATAPAKLEFDLQEEARQFIVDMDAAEGRVEYRRGTRPNLISITYRPRSAKPT